MRKAENRALKKPSRNSYEANLCLLWGEAQIPIDDDHRISRVGMIVTMGLQMSSWVTMPLGGLLGLLGSRGVSYGS